VVRTYEDTVMVFGASFEARVEVLLVLRADIAEMETWGLREDDTVPRWCQV
jgi:hypothetical protein